MTTTQKAFGHVVHPTTHIIPTGQFKTSYRVWGTGTLRALFLHGGPGQAVIDYKDTNFEILDPTRYTVLEPDQLGTGSSQPSIRDSILNAELYAEIKPYDIAAALVKVLDHLGWEKVYLHGGSWGSTLALLFAQMFPERVSGMVLRGIWLGSKQELNDFYDIETVAKISENGKKAREEMNRYVLSRGFNEGKDPNKAEDILPFYRSLLLQGSTCDRDLAAWNYWVHERFYMNECSPGFFFSAEKDYEKLVMDYEEELKEARSVAFWEVNVCNAFLNPHVGWDLLGGISKIPKHIRVDIIHGMQDYLCPVKHARALEERLKANGNPVRAAYIDSGHKVTNDEIREAVREAAVRFAHEYTHQ